VSRGCRWRRPAAPAFARPRIVKRLKTPSDRGRCKARNEVHGIRRTIDQAALERLRHIVEGAMMRVLCKSGSISKSCACSLFAIGVTRKEGAISVPTIRPQPLGPRTRGFSLRGRARLAPVDPNHAAIRQLGSAMSAYSDPRPTQSEKASFTRWTKKCTKRGRSSDRLDSMAEERQLHSQLDSLRLSN
jgi:hypothetical protein